jgi:hypothetical protein
MSEFPKDLQLAIGLIKNKIDSYTEHGLNVDLKEELDRLLEATYEAGQEAGHEDVRDDPLSYLDPTDFVQERE